MTRNKLLNLATLAGNFGNVEVAYQFANGDVYRVYFDGVAYGQDTGKSFDMFGKMIKSMLRNA